MQKIRIAILGYGRSGSTMHAGAVAANAEAFEMVAACDIDPQRRRQAEERFGCRVYERYDEMLRQEKLDMVSVVTRSDQHCRMAIDCLEAGVDVLVTKPWAVSVAEAESMVAAEARCARRIYPWLPARWGSDLSRLRELVQGGAIGKVFFVRRAVCSFGTRCDWQTERRFGGGYLLNWGAHIIDPPLLLCGSPAATVYGRMRQTINPGDVEDIFYALITTADGTFVQTEYTVATEDLPGWFVQGDQGTITVMGKELRVHHKVPDRPDDPTLFGTMKAAGQAATTETLAGSPWGDEVRIYRELAASRRGGAPYPVSSQDALRLSRVFGAVRESHERNAVVTLLA